MDAVRGRGSTFTLSLRGAHFLWNTEKWSGDEPSKFKYVSHVARHVALKRITITFNRQNAHHRGSRARKLASVSFVVASSAVVAFYIEYALWVRPRVKYHPSETSRPRTRDHRAAFAAVADRDDDATAVATSSSAARAMFTIKTSDMTIANVVQSKAADASQTITVGSDTGTVDASAANMAVQINLTLSVPNSSVSNVRQALTSQNFTALLAASTGATVSTSDVSFILNSPTCASNERVASHVCVACASGMMNEPGDDPTGSDTFCVRAPPTSTTLTSTPASSTSTGTMMKALGTITALALTIL